MSDEEKTVFIISLLGSFHKTFLNKISAEIEVNREVTPFFASITPRKKFYKTDARLKEKMASRN